MTILSFKGAFFYSIILEIFEDRAKSSDCMLLEDNSLINLSLTHCYQSVCNLCI